MSALYQVGSPCEDCLQHGYQNHLKTFYINLDEQIIKCESSKCMFPYLRKPTNSKPDTESTTFIDEFIEQSLRQINVTPTKMEPSEFHTAAVKDISNEFDFSTLFMNSPVKSESKQIPSNVKQEQSFIQSTNVMESKLLKSTMQGNIKKLKSSIVKEPAKKPRISRCLSDVKRTTKKQSTTSVKKPVEKILPVMVVEPQSGKPMRPLDLIKHYMKSKQN